MNPISSYSKNVVVQSDGAAAAASTKAASNDSLKAAGDSSGARDTVSLSGHALLLSRLFGEDESSYTGNVESRDSGDTSLARYLTKDDRAMLEQMYEYSQKNGLDLSHVDALGADLGGYRKFGAATGAKGLYDLEGHALTVTQSGENQQILDRIKSSGALSSTSIDSGFLQSEMATGGHAANYAFLERMVNVFSTGAQAASAPIAAYNAQANKLVVTASADVQLNIPEADYVSVNGVGHWRTAELAAAHGASAAGAGAAPVAPDMSDLFALLDRVHQKNNSFDQLPEGVKTIVSDWLSSTAADKAK